MTRLALNLSANLLSNVWATALSVLFTPVYVGLLGIESYGLIGLYASVFALVAVLDSGVSATALRQIAWLRADEAERRRIPTLLRTLEVVYLGALTVLSIVLAGCAWWGGTRWLNVEHLSPHVLREALVLLSAAVALQLPAGLYSAGLMGLQRQVESSAVVAIFGTLRAVGAAALLMYVAADIRVFFAWQIVVSCLQTVFTRWLLWRAVAAEGPAIFSPDVLRSMRRFAGGMTVITAISVIVSQADKIILTRLVSLETFGLYALAWTVASGLSRVVTPLIQAFSPQFTELVARKEDEALARHLRRASQLTSALILPPAAVLIVCAYQVLLAWMDDAQVASAGATLLALLTLGTVLSASSYPALSVLYSRNRLRAVVGVMAVSALLLLPALVLAVRAFGAIGAAACWVVNGTIMYFAFETFGLQGLPDTRVVKAVLRDLVGPAALSLLIAVGTYYVHALVSTRFESIVTLTAGVVVGWAAALICCTDLLTWMGAAKWAPARLH